MLAHAVLFISTLCSGIVTRYAKKNVILT